MNRKLVGALSFLLFFWSFTGLVRGQNGGTWQLLAPMPTARQEVASAVLDGKVYVLGGFDADGFSSALVEVYNPATDTWSSVHPLPSAVNHNSAAVAAGKLYSFGASGTAAYVYQPASDSWAPIASMHFQHGETPAVGVFNDKIYVAGGTNFGVSETDLEVFNPATNAWTVLASMSVPRNHTAGAFLNGKFYVAGGRGVGGAADAFESYDPQTNSWTTRPSLPTPRSGVAVAALDGEIYVFGGEIPGFHAEVEAYNPVTNTWRSLPLMPNPRHGFWAAVIGDRAYLAGGGGGQGFSASNSNQVFTVVRTATYANISTRGVVGTDEDVLIGGFIVTGPVSKRIAIRAIGPSLPVNGGLADPVLGLFDADGQPLATNDNWQTAPNKQEIIDATLAPNESAESAILTRLAPGNYTATVSGAANGTGVALVEVYDLEAGSESQMANISTRGVVGTDEDVLIGGLILTGTEPRKVIVRAIGPSLPVAGRLTNLTLELRNADGTLVAGNDNWRSDQEAEIIATTIPPENDLESAIVRTLPPAHYTAIVRGVGEAKGVALVEAYAL